MLNTRFADLGIEAIDFQSGALFAELTKAIGSIRKTKQIKQTELEAAEIPQIIRAHTNIQIELKVDPNHAYNAYVIPPQVDKNHPFYQEHIRPYIGMEGVTAIRALGGKARAGVDRKAGKVKGIYERFISKVYLTNGLLDSNKFSDGEVAAILLHEIGHIFTYFEFLGNTFTTNYVLACAAHGIMGTNDAKEREAVLIEVDRALGVDVKTKEKIIKSDDKVIDAKMSTIYLSAVAEKSRAELGANLYDTRSWEQLSDQFATRHGAGRDLVTGLDKIYRAYGHPSTFDNIGFLSYEALKFVTLSSSILVPIAVGAPLLSVFGITYLLVACVVLNPQDKVYDDPKARVKLVRQQLNEALKSKTISDQKRKAILEDIELIKSVEEQLNEKRSLNEFLWAKVFPWGRKSASQEELMKQLEELANNEMFVMAAKFKVGANNA